jgi:hypothetical protein
LLLLLNCARKVFSHTQAFTQKHPGRTDQRLAIEDDPEVFLGSGILACQMVENRPPEPGIFIRRCCFRLDPAVPVGSVLCGPPSGTLL